MHICFLWSEKRMKLVFFCKCWYSLQISIYRMILNKLFWTSLAVIMVYIAVLLCLKKWNVDSVSNCINTDTYQPKRSPALAWKALNPFSKSYCYLLTLTVAYSLQIRHSVARCTETIKLSRLADPDIFLAFLLCEGGGGSWRVTTI